jgi:hypothetical protein
VIHSIKANRLSRFISRNRPTLVTNAAIELNEHSELVVANVAEIWQAVPALLSIPAGQPMGSFHIVQVLHFQGRLGSCRHLPANFGHQLPMPVTTALVHRLEQAPRRSFARLHSLGNECDRAGFA